MRPYAIIDHDETAAPSALWPIAPVLLALTAIWLLFAWPWVFGEYTIPWDGKAHFAPQVQFMAASFARGEWPWWTPNIFAGHPQVADPQSMIFSPPMLMLALANGQPSLRAIDTAVLLTVLFGGAGAVVYARLAGWHWAAALIAATLLMFGGSMAWRLQHFGQVMSLAYVPFTLVCLKLAVERGSVLAGVGAGVLGAFVILGRDQVGLISIYVLAAFVAYLWFAEPHRMARIRRSIPPLIGGAVTGLAIVAIPITLTILFADQSNRPQIDLDGAGAGSLHPALLATSVAANLYGSAGDMADFWGPPSFHWEGTGLYTAQNMGVVYMSAFALMAVAYAVVRDRAADKPVAFFTFAATLVLAYALGWFTPLFQAAYAVLPGIDKFRRPADATFVSCGLISFVVGYGTHRLFTDAKDGEEKRSVPVFLGLALTLIAGAAAIAIWRERLPQAAPALMTAAILFTATIAAWLIARWLMPIRPIAAGLLMVAVVAVDLRISNGPNGATALPRVAIDMLEPDNPHPTIARLKELVSATTTASHRPRVELTGLGYHWPNASLTHGLENTLAANPLRLSWYQTATGAGDTVANIDQRTFTPLMPSYASPFADRLGLRYIVTNGPAPAAMIGGTDGLKLIDRIDRHHIYENEGTSPRVAAVANRNTFDPLPGATATIARYTNTRVDIEVSVPQAGWLVLHDTWHPWWFATVADEPVPVLRASSIFRAVAIPAGDHVVRFEFRPLEGAWRQLTGSRIQ